MNALHEICNFLHLLSFAQQLALSGFSFVCFLFLVMSDFNVLVFSAFDRHWLLKAYMLLLC